ncbi:sigma-70 family RNA polymerase sigma factor [Brevibacillus laterosporus]|uniref:sigma-70 family RNA polymerase sigma factor n=1 Tax=Brevibacillus laterosporus TaxID=1465 RepID=UPI003D23F378
MNTALGNDVNTLVQNHLSFVHFILKKYYPPAGLDYDDFFQIGCIGLVKAAQRFDATLGFKFTTYAGIRIKSEIQKVILLSKRAKRSGKVVSLDYPIEDGEGTLQDLLANYDSVEEEVEASLLFNELIRKEPVITKLALQGYTQMEIGRKLGISQNCVSQKMQSMKKAAVAMC